jgi:hypothetical protein
MSDWLILGSVNRAPTDQHPTHHKYIVFAYFNDPARVIGLAQSIGGGIGDMGGSLDYDLPSLLALPDWKDHFRLAGCEWAIPIIESGEPVDTILNRLATA